MAATVEDRDGRSTAAAWPYRKSAVIDSGRRQVVLVEARRGAVTSRDPVKLGAHVAGLGAGARWREGRANES